MSSRLLRGPCILLVVALAQLGGCSIYSLPGQQPVPVEERPDYTEVPPPAELPGAKPGEGDSATPSASQPLLDRARESRARGDYEQSLALLERAQRIDADNAQVYLEMARTHQARGDYAQATATAERGLLYCRSKSQCNALRDLAD